MCQLKLFLFGTPRVEVDGQSLGLPRCKSMLLAIYLLTTQQLQLYNIRIAPLWLEPDRNATHISPRRALPSPTQTNRTEWIDTARGAVELTRDRWMQKAQMLTNEAEHSVFN